MPSPHSASLRRGRRSAPDHTYLLTTVTHRRRPVFADFDLARLAVRTLRECDNSGASRTLAYVLMPDHLHWLLTLQKGDLSAVVRHFKSVSARHVNRALDTVGIPLWQAGFHDHAVRHEEALAAVARYVVANPVRAGLVASVKDYPHWDAIWV